MKKLLSCLGLASALIFTTSSPSSATEFRIINASDVKYPAVNQPFRWIPNGNISEMEFKVDGRKAKLRFKLDGNGYDEKERGFFFDYSGAFAYSVDLDGNGEFEEDEEFVIDYKNSQKVNPLAAR